MRKVFASVIAGVAIAATSLFGFVAPAYADSVSNIDSWNTTVTPKKDGSVLVSSEISPLEQEESFDIAFPITAEFDKISGWGGKRTINYGYTDFKVSKGYAIDVKLTKDVWAIASVKTVDKNAEPLTFSYVVHNALFEGKDKKLQQMNLPLVDSTFSSTVDDYTVTVASDFAPDAVCLRNTGIATDECIEKGEEESITTTSVPRKAGERISLRVKYPAKSFADLTPSEVATEEGTITAPSAALPEAYLKEFTSWNADVSLNEKTGTFTYSNRIEFDKNKKNSDTIAIAYPVSKEINEQFYAH